MTEAGAAAVGGPQDAGRRTGRWLSLHVFYAAEPDPLLVECVAPLVDALRRRGLLYRWFFIRYWLEGPHVRLRLRPATAADEPEVRRLTGERVEAFLRERPAVDRTGAADPEAAAATRKRLFLAEYSEQEWDARYGPGGTMPVRPTNSFAWLDYEPEYGRYGGPAGVELAEWHFERSSDTALRLLADFDVSRRGLRLGLAAQLMTVMCAAFLRDRDAVAEFLTRYGVRWSQFVQGAGREPPLEDGGGETRAAIARQIATIYRLVVADRPDPPSGPLGHWAAHCTELRASVVARNREGHLWFPAQEAPGGRGVGNDHARTLRALLGSYLHMTNNRMGVTLGEEPSLAAVVRTGVGADVTS